MSIEERFRDRDLRRLLQQTESAITSMEEMRRTIQTWLGEDVVDMPPDWRVRSLIVWAAVKRRGDVVEYEEFKRILQKIGYSPQAIGGFFAGDNSSMIHVGEDKVALRRWAAEEVEYYEDWLRTQDVP